MNNNAYAINTVMNLCANPISLDSNIDFELTKSMILEKIEDNKTTNLLIEDIFADINVYSINIHKSSRDIFKMYGYKTPYGYSSKDPSFEVVNSDGVYVIRYKYKNIMYNSFPMSTYNTDIISNYALFHDIIFCLYLNMY